MITIFSQDRLLTAEEVGQTLGIKPSTVSKWVFEKKIPYVKFGPGKKSIVMFNPKRLNEWIDERSFEPEASGKRISNYRNKPTGKKTIERFERIVSKA